MFSSFMPDDDLAIFMVRNESTTNRRRYLKYAGGAMIAGLAGCSGNGENGDEDGGGNGGGGEVEPNHPTDHSDGELSDAEKTGEDLMGNPRTGDNLRGWDDATVMLQHKPSDGKACSTCTLYVPDANDDGYGACTAVEGTIHSCDFCVLYDKYDGETPDPCEQV